MSYLSVESDEVCVFFLFFVQFNVSHLSLFISDMNRIPNTILKLQTQAGRCLLVGKIVEVTRVIFLWSGLMRCLVSH